MPVRPSRRDFLHVGFCGGIGLSLADYFALKAKADIKKYESKEGTAKSVIFIYLPGGAAHQETFDPKPYAPIEYRGPMNSIQIKFLECSSTRCSRKRRKLPTKLPFAVR